MGIVWAFFWRRPTMADTYSRAESVCLHESETMLVVDDDRLVLSFCTSVLKRAGYNVLSAEDGYTALEMCKAARSPIHLALLDFQMPKMSGHELLDCLASCKLALRFILMSGYAENELAHPALRKKWIYSFLRKPFTPSALLEAVKRELDAHTDTARTRAGRESGNASVA